MIETTSTLYLQLPTYHTMPDPSVTLARGRARVAPISNTRLFCSNLNLSISSCASIKRGELQNFVRGIGLCVLSLMAQAWYASNGHAAAILGCKSTLVVGAVGLDVARLLALVADLLAGGRCLRAVAREVAGLAAVVALAAVNAVA